MKYYIYTHSINGVIFYVGSNWMRANKNRAYEISRRDRTLSWNDYVDSNGGKEKVEIKIIETLNDKKECLKRELEIIEELQRKGLAMACKEGNSGKKNPMYGKKGKDNPNTGKIRTEEHKRKYREAFKKRMYTKICVKCGSSFQTKGANAKRCEKCQLLKN